MIAALVFAGALAGYLTWPPTALEVRRDEVLRRFGWSER